jgi:hypothetical protein
MAFYKILYWQDIPSQVKAWDDFDEVSVELAPEFMLRIDSSAQKQGLTGSDDYLNQWRWSEEEEMEGDPAEIAEKVKKSLESRLP